MCMMCEDEKSYAAYLAYLDAMQKSGKDANPDEAMASVGFVREGDRYVNSHTEFFVEFPRGPLAIGDDLDVRPVRLNLSGGYTLALSATDACRDRLAAFYHWSDRQSLQAAIDIARRQPVNLTTVRRWSKREGALDKFDEFRAALGAQQPSRPRQRNRRGGP